MLIPLGIVAASGGGAAGSFESISSNSPTTGSSITFSTIPSTYQHLQIRYLILTTLDGYSADLRFNSDSGSNYARHYLEGDGSTAFAAGNASSTYIKAAPYSGIVNSYPTVGIIDIHDYASTSKNKTVRVFCGNDNNATETDEGISLMSGIWMNTNAINSITLTLGAGVFASGSVISLYGIKGA